MGRRKGELWEVSPIRQKLASYLDMACAAVQDVLEVCGALSPRDNADAKRLLDRIVAMLTSQLGNRGYAVRENVEEYRTEFDDTESDSDTDTDTEGETHADGQ